MKKVLALILAAIIAVSTGVVAFAKGGFLASPSGNKAPVIENVEYGEDSCEPEIVITSYAERHKLSAEKRAALEKAYDEIAANKNLSNLSSKLISIATALGAKTTDLAVSDLYDISAYHKDGHEYCGSVTITISAETLKNFAALLHRHGNKDWEVVENAVVNKAENELTFTVDDLSPFAIVVDKSASDIPVTGEMLVIPAAVMVISAVSLAFVLVVLKKKKQEA
ncbi:MAG: hypothetical protein IKB88_02325 [Clostridia bacterium]|nr:hypothetical protein [Clostridia bacterium]